MIQFIFITLVNIALLIFLNFSWSSLPPLGKVLNPFRGVWVNGNDKTPKILKNFPVEKRVLIQWDDNKIPHIFAENMNDLYFAQGYLHAKDRLFQMDLQTRAGAGKLAELVGEKGLPIDEFMVRIGMREAAQRAEKEMLDDPLTKIAVESYIKGVNTYIRSLDAISLPVEYKLLNTWPKEFTTLRVAEHLKIMTFRLAGRSYDLELTRLAKKFGVDKVLDLFPMHPQYSFPIIKEEEYLETQKQNDPKDWQNHEFQSVFADYPEYLNRILFVPDRVEGFNGSNNWAVAKNKSKSGFNLLANDTHLAYSLPGIWYENQLVVKDYRVYGASFPGAPGVVIGYNENLAWGVTNATMDVMDFFDVEFKDASFEEYRFEDGWRPSVKSTEVIRSRSGKSETFEQIWTHQGIVVAKNGQRGLVMRWVAHRPSNELRPLINLATAKDVESCFGNLEGFKAPAQNFICMDRDSIGIRQNGEMPRKRFGQGIFILDGSQKENDWSEYLSFNDLPQTMNPQKGFVFSANQDPTDKKFRYYLGRSFDDHFRASRIYEQLEKRDDHDLDSMVLLQNDWVDNLARETVPLLLRNVNLRELSDEQKEFVKKMRVWTYWMGPELEEPSLFYYWWKNLRNSIWKDQLWEEHRPLLPPRSRTLSLLLDIDKNGEEAQAINLFWLDDVTTSKIETLEQMVTQSFLIAWEELSEKFGSRPWKWVDVNFTQIKHLAKIPGFGSEQLMMGGSYNSPGVNTGEHGAAWRMIVKAGDKLEGWTNFPGGVSGNPFSSTYEEFVKPWSQGVMKKTYFWIRPQDQKSELKIVGENK